MYAFANGGGTGGTREGGGGVEGDMVRATEHMQASLQSLIQWNLNLTKCHGNGEISWLYRKPQFHEFLANIKQNVHYMYIEV